MTDFFSVPKGREPLADYPWQKEADHLFSWLIGKDSDVKCFAFDFLMSLAYVDATSGLERFIQYCPNAPAPYNLHVGFINLCSPCYENANIWKYQKAAKPQSGVLGKLSSEIILRFLGKTSSKFISVKSIGGVDSIDAVLEHESGLTILAEVKCAPLLTYPVLFRCNDMTSNESHENPEITTSQLLELDSALCLHGNDLIHLGKPKDLLWPFKSAIDFITNSSNEALVASAVQTWCDTKSAYSAKDRSKELYYLANASGRPPTIARDKHDWPKSEPISDGKTSAGMDRTDDIKKGVYQALKIGTLIKQLPDAQSYKTAIISNLPAYRHGEEYVEPFLDILWGIQQDIETVGDEKYISTERLRRLFDYIITIDNPVLRDISI